MEQIQLRDLVLTVMPDPVGVKEDTPEFQTTQLKSQAKPTRKVTQSRLILAHAKMQGVKGVRKVGNGEMISEPIVTNGWLVMPKDAYKGIIPREGLVVAESLTKGIAIKGFLVAEDLRAIEAMSRVQPVLVSKTDPVWGKIASGVGWVVGAIALAGFVISFLPAVLTIGAIGMAFMLYDPLLIAVTEENEWVCVFEWWQPH